MREPPTTMQRSSREISGKLTHTRWECKFRVVFIPKYWRKAIFRQICKELGEVFCRLTRQKQSVIEEDHIMSDHVPIVISIPPKYAGYRVHQGEECDPYCLGVCGQQAKLRRPALLGERILRIDGGSG